MAESLSDPVELEAETEVFAVYTDASYESLRERDDLVWIDVRSESEFAESTIPGAVHVSLFDDEERALIGTLYKQAGPEEARDLGLELASAKLPALVKTVRSTLDGRVPVVFCWRGGMRSKTVATVLDLVGVTSFRLAGGYRAYRQFVTERLAAWTTDELPLLIVLHGMTGVGKTDLLRELQACGEPVLDLEGMAGHRGSVFGGIGLRPANQRQFDARLLDELERLAGAPYVIMEAESRRIGRVSMPDFLFEAKLGGVNVEVTAPIAVRVQRTLAQYRLDGEDELDAAVAHAVRLIEKRFSPELRARVNACVHRRDFAALTEALLVDYYDPRYRHAMQAYPREFVAVNGADLQAAARAVRDAARAAVGLAHGSR